MARRNPLRSEAEAYRFLLLTIGYFALIVGAAIVSRWLGLVVFIVLTVAAAWLWWRRGEREPEQHLDAPHLGGADERRLVVLANETVAGNALRERIEERSAGVREQVLVVVPALNSRVRHWASDDASAREEAELRLQTSLRRLREVGVDARGEVGDSEPLTALDDAVRSFGPDEVIISTHPEGRSHWLERGVVERARERYDLPVTHVIVDLAAESEEVV
jgi:GABA permease